mgnify:CR=1 FL=1
MKRYYAEDNASSMVIITDGVKCVAIDVADRDEAINMDFSGIENHETIEEVACHVSINAVDFVVEEFEGLDEV